MAAADSVRVCEWTKHTAAVLCLRFAGWAFRVKCCKQRCGVDAWASCAGLWGHALLSHFVAVRGMYVCVCLCAPFVQSCCCAVVLLLDGGLHAHGARPPADALTDCQVVGVGSSSASSSPS